MTRPIIGTVATVIGVAVLGGLLLIYSGLYNVAATERKRCPTTLRNLP